MSDMRPSRGDPDGAASLLASADARLAAAAAELAVPAALRLTEWQRASVARMYEALVRDVEDPLRARLAKTVADEGARAALGSAHVPIAAPLLARRRTPLDAGLAARLLRRLDEHRIDTSTDHSLLMQLAGDADSAVAAGAMELLIAQTSRVDAFGDPVIGRSDLPAEHLHRLAWSIAAALRVYILDGGAVAQARADAALAAAVTEFLAGYDEGEGADACALRLARRLSQLDRLDGPFVLSALRGAGLPLFLATVAVRTGVGAQDSWDLLREPTGRGALILLRAAGLGPEAAAELLLALGHDEAGVAARLGSYDTLAHSEADALLDPWRTDPAYRTAVLELAR